MLRQKKSGAVDWLHLLLLLILASSSSCLPQLPTPVANSSVHAAAASSSYWVSNIQRQGTVAFGGDASYNIFRNVMDYGAKGK